MSDEQYHDGQPGEVRPKKRRSKYRDGWFKVSRRLLESSLWAEDPVIIKVFLALLEAAQQPTALRKGTVIISRPILAARCLIAPAELDRAIERLSSPDSQSRTEQHHGRRIEVLANGFRVLNYGLYHDVEAEAELSRKRRNAGTKGGLRSGEGRRNQQVPSKQAASKKEADRDGDGDGDGDGDSGNERPMDQAGDRKQQAGLPAIPPSDDPAERARLVEYILATAPVVAKKLSWSMTRAIREASTTPNGLTFYDPREKRVTLAWLRVTADKLPKLVQVAP